MRHRRRRRGEAGTAASLSSQLMGLSLFVMLLAFFIVLNAISTFETTKVRPVMENLNYTFSSRSAGPIPAAQPSVREEPTASVSEGSTLERIKALFTAQIPGSKIILSQNKGVMYMRVSLDDLESAVMAVGQRNALEQKQAGAAFLKGFFLPTLVALMKTDETGMPYRMDIILNIGENPALLQNRQPKQMEATIKRMSRIARKIEDAGVTAKLLSTGMQKGDEGTVDLLFRRHIPFDPSEDKKHEQ